MVRQFMNCKPLWDLNNGITFCEAYHNLTKLGRRR